MLFRSVEFEFDEQEDEKNPGRRREDRNRIDGECREENQQVRPHQIKIVAQRAAGSQGDSF